MSRITVAAPIASGREEVSPVNSRSKVIGRPQRVCWYPKLAPRGWLGPVA